MELKKVMRPPSRFSLHPLNSRFRSEAKGRMIGASVFMHTQGAAMITLHTTLGDITMELNFVKAPKTAANFKQYEQEGFYNGNIFNQVISNFIIHGVILNNDLET